MLVRVSYCSRASDSMFLFIDFVRVTNCFYDYDYDLSLWQSTPSHNAHS